MGFPPGYAGYRRKRAGDDDGEVGQRTWPWCSTKASRFDRRLLALMKPERAAARHDANQLRQSERAARGRPDHVGARSGDPRPRQSFATCRNTNISITSPSIRFGRRVTNNFNHLIGRYPGARRLQDRLHLRLRLYLVGLGDAQRQAADRGRARLHLRSPARGCAPPSCSSALCQQRARLACVPRSAPSIIWFRSTPRHRILRGPSMLPCAPPQASRQATRMRTRPSPRRALPAAKARR